MQLVSKAHRTELGLHAFDGSIENRGDHLVVRSPLNPTFHWGNCLLFGLPPAAGDLQRWEALFVGAFGSGTRHRAFGWDGNDGETGVVDPFLAAGYELSDDPVMTIEHVPTPRASEARVRRLQLADWSEVERLNVAADPMDGKDDGYALFKERLRARYRAMIEAGRGVWLGAFLEEDLVGQLGLFPIDGIGRFQSVETHPGHRRRGVCSALVAKACRLGLEELGLKTLLLVAEEGSPAQRVYRAAGFEVVARQTGVHRSQPRSLK